MILDLNADTIIDTISQSLGNSDIDISSAEVEKIVNHIDNCLPGLIGLIVSEGKENWIQEALSAGGWGKKYAEAIRGESKGLDGTLFIDEEMKDKGSNKTNFMFAMMMEKGVSSWSIKDALLKSEKAKDGFDGNGKAIRYIVVPLPVSTPRKEGQGTMSSEFGGREMSKEMYKIVKSGETLGAGSVNVTTVSGTKQVNVSGLTKFKTAQLHSGYGIFRCVTSNSKGWQYPGIEAQPIFKSVCDYMDRRIQEIMTEFCTQIVKEYTGK